MLGACTHRATAAKGLLTQPGGQVQAMRDLGYARSAAALEEEAGVRLKSQSVAALETAVLRGAWQDVQRLIQASDLGLSQVSWWLLLHTVLQGVSSTQTPGISSLI